jgi:sulfur-oxidizing protein SoxB
MVRVGGMSYTCDPNAKAGSRISGMRVHDNPMAADKVYKVAGWAPVDPSATGEPVWDVVSRWLKDKKTVSTRKVNVPKLIGMKDNPGIA